MSKIQLMEHLALRCEMELRPFCARLRLALNLPPGQFDYENATEWATFTVGQLEYNVSRPYEDGTLQEWNDSVPAGCNFAIGLHLLVEHPPTTHEWRLTHLVEPVAKTIAAEFGQPVHYHSTWLGPGLYERRNRQFAPAPGDAPRFAGTYARLPPPAILRGLLIGAIPPENIIQWAQQTIFAHREAWLEELASLPPEPRSLVDFLQLHGGLLDDDDSTFLALLAYGFFRSNLSLKQTSDLLHLRFRFFDKLVGEALDTPLQQQIAILDAEMERSSDSAAGTCARILEPHRIVGEEIVDRFFKE